MPSRNSQMKSYTTWRTTSSACAGRLLTMRSLPETASASRYHDDGLRSEPSTRMTRTARLVATLHLVVRASLRELSENIYQNHLDTAVACISVCECGAAALDHAEASREKGWSLPASGKTLTLKGLTPFWLDRTSAVPNDVFYWKVKWPF